MLISVSNFCKVWLISVVCLIGPLSAQFQRKLTAEKSPNCKDTNELSCDINLFYIKAVGENDTIHYLWDLTGKPSLLLAHTQPNISLEINWNEFMKNSAGSVYFSSRPNYVFLVIIDELIEFEDIDDTGYLTEDSKNISYSTGLMQWSLSQPLKLLPEQDAAFCEVKGTNFTGGNFTLSGSTFLQLTAFGAANHDFVLPRLLHSANSSQVKLIIQGLSSNSGFAQSRWAVKLLIVSTDQRNGSLDVDARKNLDDENSPGVFTIINVMTPDAEKRAHHGAYLQWRPVVYTAPTPSIGNSSDVAVMDPSTIEHSNLLLNGTLATKLFSKKLEEMLVQSTIVSFGSPQDGFYKKTNYSSWAFLVSYGSPQMEGFSMMIILVMAIGLGLPAALIFFGGIFMCARRCSRRKDELSLER